jgi:hypothetical protein
VWPVWLPIFKTRFRVCKTKITSPTKKKKMFGTPFLHFVLQNKCGSVVGPPCFSKHPLAVLDVLRTILMAFAVNNCYSSTLISHPRTTHASDPKPNIKLQTHGILKVLKKKN